ncbi:15093_t:CDS:2 [Gigaspora margarita]|uniref:15093_t:CDS:1 n=1 Tax=Gigaspora margarita TaxID=4874 RepID=A0ABN7WEB2_GIGMA|nr:15093_t:CDS:2 [Gigaspora margarita]
MMQKSAILFYWDSSQTKDQHTQDQIDDYRVVRQEYLLYLKSIITLTSEIDWYDPKSKKGLLFLDDKALFFSVSRIADIVITDKLFAKVHDLYNGIYVRFKIKKKIQDSYIHQAIGELIIANTISQFPKVIQYPATLLHAINIIETILVRDTDENIRSAIVTNSIAMPKVNFKFDDDIANMNNVLEVTTREEMLC